MSSELSAGMQVKILSPRTVQCRLRVSFNAEYHWFDGPHQLWLTIICLPPPGLIRQPNPRRDEEDQPLNPSLFCLIGMLMCLLPLPTSLALLDDARLLHGEFD